MIRWGAVLALLGLVSALTHADQALQDRVQRARVPRMDRVMQTATDLGRKDVLAWGLLGLAILDVAEGAPTARLAVASLVSVNLVVEGLKRAVGRPRPDGERQRSNSSFPSGHAASAFGLAVVLARRWRRPAPLFFALATVVASSRIYLNRHFLSDVLCGVAIGLVVTWLVLRWWPWRRRAAAG